MVLFTALLVGDKGDHTIPNGMSSKVKIRARLEFELTYFKTTFLAL